MRTGYLAARVETILNSELPPRPPRKTFQPKCPELPLLQTYAGEAPKSFWDKFPVNRNIHGKSPYVMNPDRLVELAEEAGVLDMELAHKVANDIRCGADLKVLHGV